MAIKGVYFLIGDEQAEVGISEWIKRYNNNGYWIVFISPKKIKSEYE